MTFLSPFPAIVAAAICVPALLVLYLLKLRRRPVRVSSTMFWAARTRDLQVNVPLRWLKPSWLLFLQMLILALFLLALARPALDMEGAPPSRIVLLIDRSASMSARGGATEPTRLDAAKAAAVRVIDDLVGGGGEACVVAFAHEARAATAFLRDRGALRAAVNGVAPTDQPGDLAGALRLAGALLASGAPESGNGEGAASPRGLVALFSDGWFGGVGAGAPGGGFALSGAEFRYFRAGPPDTDAPPADNLGIVAVAARRDLDDPGTVRVFARVQNAGAAAASVPVALILEGEVVDRRALTVPGATTGSPAASVGVTLEARTTGGGVLAVRLERDDALASDNEAAVVLAPAARPRILLIIPDLPAGAPPGTEGPEWLIADPLRELRARSFRVITESVYRQLAASESGLGADLVLFDRVRPDRVPPVPTLSFGAGVPIPGADLAASNLGGTYVLAWERAHPVLRSVSMDAVYVARPMRVVEPGPAGASPGVEITELARGRDGPLLLLVEEGPTRRLVAAFEAAQSNWPVDPGFAVFLAEAADYLTLRGEDQVGGGAGATFTTTTPVEVTVEGSPERLVLRGPTEIAVRVPEGGGPGVRRRLGVGVIERVGVYQAEGAVSPVAVNLLDETESAIRTRDVLTVSGEESRAAEGGRGPREVWPWFVLAALVLLGLEWFLHAWQMRA
ncbi:MAG: VWA domain-containing protein [Phycisphaerales bacterium]